MQRKVSILPASVWLLHGLNWLYCTSLYLCQHELWNYQDLVEGGGTCPFGSPPPLPRLLPLPGLTTDAVVFLLVFSSLYILCVHSETSLQRLRLRSSLLKFGCFQTLFSSVVDHFDPFTLAVVESLVVLRSPL